MPAPRPRQCPVTPDGRCSKTTEVSVGVSGSLPQRKIFAPVIYCFAPVLLRSFVQVQVENRVVCTDTLGFLKITPEWTRSGRGAYAGSAVSPYELVMYPNTVVSPKGTSLGTSGVELSCLTLEHLKRMFAGDTSVMGPATAASTKTTGRIRMGCAFKDAE
eukprot:gene23357-biopygen4321